MGRLILGVDAGNHRAKVVGSCGIDTFRTAICDWFERNVIERFDEDDMEFEIDGRKGFAGTIATVEDEFGGGSMFGESKAHDDNKVRILLALYRYINKYCPGEHTIGLVTGQPIVSHKPEEKEAIRSMLIGPHEIFVNGRMQRLNIMDVRIAPEGAAAFWSNPMVSEIKILDIGSATINACAISNKRVVNTFSDTFNIGMETVSDKENLERIARGIIRKTTELKWKKTDKVLVCGGVAEDILPHITEHYTMARVLVPQYRKGEGKAYPLNPVYANAVGFYELAKGAFG